MRKIPTLFKRDLATKFRTLTREPHPSCRWVIDGEGVATRKYDGTCVMLDKDGKWWARREVKPGGASPALFNAIATDDETGKTVGWAPITSSSFAPWHAEALGRRFAPGTYELCGPKINGNPEGFPIHTLIRHADAERLETPRDYDGLETWLRSATVEGIVWHHPDGRMAKIKRKDF